MFQTMKSWKFQGNYVNNKINVWKFQSNQNISLLFPEGISSWNFQGGYTIIRYFPGGMAMKYGKFQGIYINNKMFGNFRGPKQNVTFSRGLFPIFSLGISGEGMQLKGIFHGDMTMKAWEFQRGGGM